LLFALSALALGGCGKKAQPPASPPEVLVIEVKPEEVAIYDDLSERSNRQ